MACSENKEIYQKYIFCGSKKSEGVTWSEQLVDKVEPIASHNHWAVRHCEKDPKKTSRIHREYHSPIMKIAIKSAIPSQDASKIKIINLPE